MENWNKAKRPPKQIKRRLLMLNQFQAGRTNNKLRYRDCISMSLHSSTRRRAVFISQMNRKVEKEKQQPRLD